MAMKFKETPNVWNIGKFKSVMKFQCGKETNRGITIEAETMVKFQREQRPIVETQFIGDDDEIPIVEKRLIVGSQLNWRRR